MLLAVAPWVRNRHYLRDLYDYGLVWAADGHLERGERPYVDFTTPIQAGFLGMNWGVERLTGGTYGGLTLGAAGLILLSTLLGSCMLSRRWPAWLAVLTAGAVTVASASQHTILWHNSLGVFGLALAAWATAIAPVLRLRSWPWHALAAAGLLLGGLNKINFQLVALCAAGAWGLLAGLTRQARWRRVWLTLAGWLFVGTLLPFGLELAWTGATPALWWQNVVALPAGQRLHIVSDVFSLNFLFHQTHPHYGPVLVPQVGLFGLLLTTLAAVTLAWQQRSSRLGRLFSPIAALAAGGAGAVLVQTNYEICHIGLAAWLVLTVSVWLGFGASLPLQRGTTAAVAVPAAILGVVAWVSAWQGQRSQFGYSMAPRSAYLPIAQEAPEFGRLKGLLLPPGLTASFGELARRMPASDDAGRYRVFFGLGTEWLDRHFPAERKTREPLWVHWGTSYDQASIERLTARLREPDRYEAVYCTIARNEWPEEIRKVLDSAYTRSNLGRRLYRWQPRNPDAVNFDDGFATLDALGGNIVGAAFHSDLNPLTFRKDPDGRTVMGTADRSGQMLLNAPTYRLRGVAEAFRVPGMGDGPVGINLRISVHGSSPETTLWRSSITLGPGEQTKRVPFVIDPGAQRVVLWVNQDNREDVRRVFAGYRELEIEGAVEGADEAPALREQETPATAASAEQREALLAAVAWRPRQLLLRKAADSTAGFMLKAGGEIWLHTDYMTGELQGRITAMPGADVGPMARIVWYKGGRLQLMQNGTVPLEGGYSFRVWTAEPGGWIGILTDVGDTPPVKVEITSSTMRP